MKNISHKFIRNGVRYMSNNARASLSNLMDNTNGIYDGAWKQGNGASINSINPFTGNINATIKTGTVNDYNNMINKMDKVKKKMDESTISEKR